MAQPTTQPIGELERLEEAMRLQSQCAIRLASALRHLDPSTVLRTSSDLNMALRMQREVKLHIETIKRATALIHPIQLQINAALNRIAACVPTDGLGPR